MSICHKCIKIVLDKLDRNIRMIGLIVIMLSALYPVVELTRVIIVSGTYYLPEMRGHYVAEIIAMWVLYLGIIPVFILIGTTGKSNRT
jgi:hypothetical protein